MKKENPVIPGYHLAVGRITRARAAANHANGASLQLVPPLRKPDRKQTQQGGSKRAASDENSQAALLTVATKNKKRAVLNDVTNVCCENSYRRCIPVAKAQSKASQQVKVVGTSKGKCSKKDFKLAAPITSGSTLVCDVTSSKNIEGVQEVAALESKEPVTLVKVEENFTESGRDLECVKDGQSIHYTDYVKETNFRDELQLANDSKEGDSAIMGIVDIDNDKANPQMCSLYASEIYTNLCAAELVRRPCSNFMEALQRDITQSMRSILIDWLVEVSEEYKLVPDTLYLTVYIIDRFLSQNYIERQRLQLLGITCMLIASKYEEICAPRVEEFCFITDNTYSKAEVLKMETQVLRYLGYHLSVPTIKTFLRRFLRAAQASYKASSLSLGYLANYLAELTLIEYSFLKFLPSAVAASAIFLARWTLDQSDHPWNRTLEHYTSYRNMDLKATVLALHELQLNSKNCPLNSIREKYRQQKFESVATLTSPKLLPSLFC
ncbi:cyclin-A2-1-like [Ananas comosus]|uniref:Cyclin-A2-1-like n=1 Tax=Ananas comosus TaxID=4615 RepID=A0A6P5ETZ7_ANACO|nr:cyclin-A2-1-like [Ananas comosus]